MDPEDTDQFEASNTYRIRTPEGHTWMEDSNRLRVESYMNEGDVLERMWYGPPVVEWRKE